MVSWSEGSAGFSQQGAEDSKTVVVCEVDERLEELPGYTPGETQLFPTLLDGAALGGLLFLELCRRQ